MTQSRPTTRRCVRAFLPAVFLLVAAGLRSQAAEPNDSTPRAEPATDVTLRGQVLLPDGKPAEGAELYWLQLKTAAPPAQSEIWWEKRAVADDAGRFQWTLEKTDAKLGPSNRPPLVAYKAGFGLDGIAIARDEASAEITLRLAEDRPIRGRLTDTEGRPVAGAKVVVTGIEMASDGQLDRLLEKWKQDWHALLGRPERFLHLFKPFGPLAAETDAEGRFQISDTGVERVVSLNIVAPGYTSEQLRVVTREGFDATEYNTLLAGNAIPQMRLKGRLPRLTPPAFDHVMEMELVIRGAVFTGPDRKPVARARVSSSGGGSQNNVSVLTDAAGRYELHGVRRSQDVPLMVSPPLAGNLLSRSRRLNLAPGQTVVDADVELKEGIVVEVRVFDRATGRGVKSGGIRFAPLPGNRFVDQPGYEGSISTTLMLSTHEEGRFRLLVIPGPGALMAQAQAPGPQINGKRVNPYRQASFTKEEGQRVPVTVDGDDRHFTKFNNSLVSLGNENAVKVIDLPPGSGPVTCDLPLDAGKTAKIAIEDERGQPVSDAWVAGVADTWPITFKIAASTCTIYGPGADRPRRVCILHPQRRLATSLTLTGDEPQQVTVRLGAATGIGGRVLDPDGEPLAGAVVQVNYARRSASELRRFVEQENGQTKTDGQGRFQVDVVPGERFALDFRHGDSFYRAPLTDEQRELKAGQKLELGDVRPRFVQ